MTDAPKRIHAAATRWALGHGPDIDWRKGQWAIRSVMDVSQEYVRADIADEMLEAIKEFCCRVEVGEIRSKKTYAKFTAIIDKVEGGDT